MVGKFNRQNFTKRTGHKTDRVENRDVEAAFRYKIPIPKLEREPPYRVFLEGNSLIVSYDISIL